MLQSHACHVAAVWVQIQLMLEEAKAAGKKTCQVDQTQPSQAMTRECKRIAEAANWQLHDVFYIRGYGKVQWEAQDQEGEVQVAV
jgi:hypothetical protein